MKRLLLSAVLLILLAGGYYFRGFFLETQDLNIHLYTLYSGNPDELYRFEPVVEAQMRRLPILQDVNSDLQVEISETIDLDRLKAEGCDRLRDDAPNSLPAWRGPRSCSRGSRFHSSLRPG